MLFGIIGYAAVAGTTAWCLMTLYWIEEYIDITVNHNKEKEQYWANKD